ncbi:MAG: hypothetical protein ACLRL4_09280 [Bifidobacterium bifidum]
MMTEQAKVPAIRFAGFTDPWEQRKLGEFSKKNTIKNANGALSETFTNSAEQGVISQLDYFDHDITNDANISGYYVVQPDDFVYNPRISATAPCGPINRNRLNRAGVMSPLYTVFSVDASMDKAYLEHYFKHPGGMILCSSKVIRGQGLTGFQSPTQRFSDAYLVPRDL